MNTYDIWLECLCCSASRFLGTVEADSRQKAREKAAEKWPDALYREIVPYFKQQESRSASLVRQLVS